MATEAQVQANRANAQQSTGPRTPEGKATVSQNAVIEALYDKYAAEPAEPSAGPDPGASVPSDPILGRMLLEDFSGARVLERVLLYERRIESSLYRAMNELWRPPTEPRRRGHWAKQTQLHRQQFATCPQGHRVARASPACAGAGSARDPRSWAGRPCYGNTCRRHYERGGGPIVRNKANFARSA